MPPRRPALPSLPLPPLPFRPHWTPVPGVPGGKPKYGHRPGDFELASRVELVAALIIRGKSRADVIRYVAEETDWSVTDDTIDNYLARGREWIGAAPMESIAQTTRKLIARLEYLYDRCVEKGDERTALRVARELATFRGVGRMNRARLAALASGAESPEPTDETPAVRSDAQRAAVVAELLATARARARAASGVVTLATGPDAAN